MLQKVSMADIARELGISRATVSYVLNERESELISEGTRQRVLNAAREMGYRRNRAAQALAGQRSYLVELCVSGFYPAFYGYVLEEFARHSAPTPYQLHIVKPSVWDEKIWDNHDGGWPVDGIIIFDVGVPEGVLASLQERGVPIVSVGIYPHESVDHVTVELSSVVQNAVRHLARQGKRVACVLPWTAEYAATLRDPRYPAYQQVLQEANLSVEVVTTPDARSATREIVREYIQKNGCPDAIFCFNDERAIATHAALRDLNVRVPDDVKIIGCDGLEETLYHSPALSTIEYPVKETAQLAWQFLLNRLDNPDIPLQSATLTAQLALRESSS